MGVSCAYRQGRRVEKGGDVEVDVFFYFFDPWSWMILTVASVLFVVYQFINPFMWQLP